MKEEISETDHAALAILKKTGLDVVEAAQLAHELLQASKGRGSRWKRARECIRLGEEALVARGKTVVFRKAVDEAMEARQDRRKRTRDDFRYISRRLLRFCPEIARRPVRFITPRECRACLEKSFDTLRQRHKARLVLSGIFGTAVKRGWCTENPVAHVDLPRLKEHFIPVLSLEEMRRLLAAAEEYDGGACLAAVGLMLYAGIRPEEVRRLDWAQINLREGMVSLRARHSKTGGARIVTIQPVLGNLLCKCGGKIGCYGICVGKRMPAQLAGEVEGAETVGRVGREGKEVACGYVKAYVCQLFCQAFQEFACIADGNGACFFRFAKNQVFEYGRHYGNDGCRFLGELPCRAPRH